MKHLLRIMLLVVLLGLALPVAAQTVELSQTVELPDDMLISIPENWEADIDENLVFLSDEDFFYLFMLMTPEQLGSLWTESANSDVSAALIEIADWFNDLDEDSVEADAVEIGSFKGARVDFAVDEGWMIAVLLEVRDGRFAYLAATINSEDFDSYAPLVEAIIATYLPAEAAGDAAAPVVASGAPCFVSVETADSARLRVGPGENRSAVAFLPAKESFEAQGRFVTEDGGVWFKLDKEQAAPRSAASEIWVAEFDVVTEGGCASIGEADAPPVIPASNNAPPPASGNDDQSGGGQSSGGTTNAGGTVPSSGTWSFSLAPNGNASCAGGANVPFNTSDLMAVTSFSDRLSSGGAQSFSFAGATFNQVAAGSYLGSLNFGASNAQIRLFVQNTGLMTGEMVVNTTINDTACSATIGLTMQRG